MIIEKKEMNLGINSDVNTRSLPPGFVLNAMNCRYGVSQYGRDKRYENVPGTVQIQQAVYPPYGANQCIGSTIDPASNRMLYFLYNSFGFNAIYCFDFDTRLTYAVLYDSQVDTGLNFSKTARIDRNAYVSNGLLYWCEGENNQPRVVNIDAGISANHAGYVTDEVPYSFPLSFDQITLIKRACPTAPNIQKSTDANFENNFIATDSFQFAFMYDWYDGEETVVGTYSQSTRLNKTNETANYIAVQMDSNETIPSRVRIVNLVVRFSNTNRAFVVKTWDREIQSQNIEIYEQNNDAQPLTFNFYNDLTGRYISPDYVLKGFDVVPVYCYTLAQARNRNFLANNIEGYDTPHSTSLEFVNNVSNLSAAVSLVRNLIEVRLRVGVPGGSNNYNYAAYYVYIDSGATTGYYLVNGTEKTAVAGSIFWLSNPALDPAPTTVSVAGLTFIGDSQQDVFDYVMLTYTGDNIIFNRFKTTTNLITITGLTSPVYDIFKTKASYRGGVVFYDFAMRKCGVVTSDGTIFEIPARDYDFTNAVTSVTWTLSNANALTEIPDWAFYYAVVRTLNLKTRYFVEAFTDAAKYASKDANGVYQYTSPLFLTGTLGIALNTNALVQAGLGYTFAQGDVAVLTVDDNNEYELPVIAQDGNYIIVSPQDIGDLSNKRIIYEIYNPYRTSEQEPFYEVGEMYLITNPGTVSRSYSVLTDIFLPDTYVLSRNYTSNTYFAEAMSPNDLFYQRWDNDGGKPNFITQLGQVHKKNFFRFSSTYIPGTQTNGLSTFDAPNQNDVSEDSGEINKLVLTSKIQDEGTVMLAICRHETNSIYLGETRVVGTDGKTQFLAQATGVVGTINNLKGSRGTINPESVFEYLGLVSWIDILNGDVVQYSNNGLDIISMNGMERFFRNYSLNYMAASTNNLNNINGFHHIPSCVDPFHKEFLFTLPALIYENYAATLPSYTSVPTYATSIISRFDVYDELGKTMAYNFLENKWGSNYEFMPEWMEYYQNTLIGFKNGVVYIHNENTDTWNTFYGVEYPVRICLAANNGSSALKQLNNIAVEGNAEPEFTVGYADYPNVQVTDLAGENYSGKEGQLYATFFRDRLSPNVVGTVNDKLYKGDSITDIALKVMLEFPQYEDLIYINFVDIGFELSKGQKQIIQT